MAGWGTDRPLVRVRALGRRPGHHHDRQGHQLGLRAARRDDRARPRLRGDQGQVLRRRAHVLGPSARVRRRRRLDRGVQATRASSRTRPRWATCSPRSCRSSPSATRRSATCAARALLGPRARAQPRDARAARAVQRRRRGGRADGARWRRRALERGLYLFVHWNVIMVAPPLNDHPRGARRGPRHPRRGARRSPTSTTPPSEREAARLRHAPRARARAGRARAVVRRRRSTTRSCRRRARSCSRASAGCDGLVTMLTDRVDAELLDAAGSQLRIVANYAVGLDNVDLDECERRGIAVSNTPDVLTDATAEMTIALMLALTPARRRRRPLPAPPASRGTGRRRSCSGGGSRA